MTETTKATPNKQLRNARINCNWSQEDVAEKVGTTALNIGRWERGVTQPGPFYRRKLCEVFERTAQELGLQVSKEQEDTQVSPPTAPPAIMPPAQVWNVPYRRNLFFTGRDTILTQLRTALTTQDTPVALAQPQAISGLGGIGKTQTAVEYAYRFRDSYEHVFWARAESTDLLNSDFLTLASQLNLSEQNEQDQSIVINAVKRWLDTHANWLLILDNAEQFETIEDFLPPSGKGHVILTTRAYATGTLAQRIDLNKMSLDDGTLFLLRRTKRLKGATTLDAIPPTTREQVQALVAAVDGLPLALDQAGAYIEETGCSFVDYLKFYQTRRTRLLRARGRDASGHPEAVAATWSLAFEKVELANPAAAELLKLCAFLHPDAIPKTMLIDGASELGPILHPIAEDEIELNEAIRELLKYSLVKRDVDGQALSIHRLVQAVIKDGMDDSTQRDWAERVVKMVSHVFPQVEFATWEQCQQYLPQAQVSKKLAEHWKIQSLETAKLFKEMALYLKERGYYNEADTLDLSVLKFYEETLGIEHLSVAEVLNMLSDIYMAQGRYKEMEPMLQRALLIQKQHLGTLHNDVAETLNNLATCYGTLGDKEQARDLLQQSLTIREQILPSPHKDIASTMVNLAAVQRDLHNYEAAESIFMRALIMSEQVLEPNHPRIAICLSNFGGLYLEQKLYEKAVPFFERSLTIKEHVLGPKHMQVALDLNNLAMIEYAQGKYEKAELLLLRTLAIFTEALGEESPDSARTLKNLGKVYAAQGKNEEADALYKRSLAIRVKTLGESHPLVALTVKDYATFLRQSGREVDALALEEQAQHATV